MIFKYLFLYGLVNATQAVTTQAKTTQAVTTQAVAQQPLKKDPLAQPTPANMWPENLVLVNQNNYFSKYIFIMDKSARSLYVWEATINGLPKLIATHPSDYGKEEGDKKIDGDHKTPEGVYFFQKKLEGPSLNFSEYGIRAFTMDYPNFFDRKKHKTGSGIWLHAIPKIKSLSRGSRGCLVVRNEVIESLTQYIQLKTTPIIITHKIKYLDKDSFLKKRKALSDWLNAWATSWSEKNTSQYMTFYASDFRTLKMDKKRWQAYKENLNKKYEYIKVSLQNVVAYTQGQQTTIRFLQNYESNLNSDFGEKWLYLKSTATGYEILHESWKAVDTQVISLKKDSN